VEFESINKIITMYVHMYCIESYLYFVQGKKCKSEPVLPSIEVR
jgi:hypothetical protein